MTRGNEKCIQRIRCGSGFYVMSEIPHGRVRAQGSDVQEDRFVRTEGMLFGMIPYSAGVFVVLDYIYLPVGMIQY